MTDKNFKHKKRFGQNFLHDQQVIEQIIAVINPQAQQAFVEIGPGLGALTTHLLPVLQKLTVIEIDKDVIPRLKAHCANLGELTICQQDALTIDLATLVTTDKLRVVGNLPYNISTAILFHLLKFANNIQDMHFMLQKEVVDRIVAAPGSKDYGRLSVMLQYYCQVEFIFMVPPESFDPPPKVNSAIVRLVPYQNKPFVAKDEKQLAQIVKQAFGQRRKTLRNSLKNSVSEEQLLQAGIDAKARAEQISVEQFVTLANSLL